MRLRRTQRVVLGMIRGQVARADGCWCIVSTNGSLPVRSGQAVVALQADGRQDRRGKAGFLRYQDHWRAPHGAGREMPPARYR